MSSHYCENCPCKDKADSRLEALLIGEGKTPFAESGRLDLGKLLENSGKITEKKIEASKKSSFSVNDPKEIPVKHNDSIQASSTGNTVSRNDEHPVSTTSGSLPPYRPYYNSYRSNYPVGPSGWTIAVLIAIAFFIGMILGWAGRGLGQPENFGYIPVVSTTARSTQASTAIPTSTPVPTATPDVMATARYQSDLSALQKQIAENQATATAVARTTVSSTTVSDSVKTTAKAVVTGADATGKYVVSASAVTPTPSYATATPTEMPMSVLDKSRLIPLRDHNTYFKTEGFSVLFTRFAPNGDMIVNIVGSNGEQSAAYTGEYNIPRYLQGDNFVRGTVAVYSIYGYKIRLILDKTNKLWDGTYAAYVLPNNDPFWAAEGLQYQDKVLNPDDLIYSSPFYGNTLTPTPHGG